MSEVVKGHKVINPFTHTAYPTPEVDEVTGNQIASSPVVEFKQQVIDNPVQENKFPAIRSQEQLDVIRRILRSECNARTVEKLMPQIHKVLNA